MVRELATGNSKKWRNKVEHEVTSKNKRNLSEKVVWKVNRESSVLKSRENRKRRGVGKFSEKERK